MKSRLTLPDPARLDEAQRAVHDAIVATRGNLHGPFLAWLHSPGLAGPAAELGAFCRYGTRLSLLESELMILCVAAHCHCLGEQQIHEPIALRAGVPEAVVQGLRQGEEVLSLLAETRQQTLVRLAQALLQTQRIEPALYAEGLQLLGEPGLVELVGLLGYYTLVAMTLNAFEMSMT